MAVEYDATGSLAEMLDAALVERNEQRWKTIAFVNRHEIAAALRALEPSPAIGGGGELELRNAYLSGFEQALYNREMAAEDFYDAWASNAWDYEPNLEEINALRVKIEAALTSPRATPERGAALREALLPVTRQFPIKAVLAQSRDDEFVTFDLSVPEMWTIQEALATPATDQREGWQPIETAPAGEWIIGLREPNDAKAPAFIGKVYHLRAGALLDEWTGRWVACTHWKPLDAPASEGEG